MIFTANADNNNNIWSQSQRIDQKPQGFRPKKWKEMSFSTEKTFLTLFANNQTWNFDFFFRERRV